MCLKHLFFNDGFKKNNDANYLKNQYVLDEIDNNFYVTAFLKIDKEIFNKNNVEILGVKLNTEAGNFFTALIPINSLESLFSVQGIISVEIAEKVHSKMDSARALTNVNQVHSGTGLPQPYTGNGVIVGVIDEGFDYTHPNFRNLSTQQTRISRVWEQSGTTASTMPYGTEYVGSTAILNKMRDKVDSSHGTHVTGIAAGSGGTTNSFFKGVAFDSEIVLVSYSQFTQKEVYTGDNTKILDGINYIFNYAKQVNKPSVVNLSLGIHVGPHDGTSTFDQMCNSLVGNGRIIVGAAGNEGSDKIHTFKNLSQENSQFSFIVFPKNTLNYSNGEALVNIWGQVGHNFEVSVNIYNVVTNEIESSTPYVSTATNSFFEQTIFDNDTSSSPDPCVVRIGTESINTNNNKPNALIEINNSKQDDALRYVLLEIRSNSGAVNTWLSNQRGIFSNLSEKNFNFLNVTNGDTNMTVGEIGGTSNSIISVGAYTSQNSYINFSGNSPSLASPGTLGSIASFSSKGPTADGRIKPDIAAPGNVVISSVSSFDSNYTTTSEKTVAGLTNGTNSWLFGAAQGTSMSAPVVTGVVALWLQANPNLTVAQIKTILQNTSITDSFTGTGNAMPSNTWGRGKINALTGVQYINQFLNLETFNSKNNLVIYPNPTVSSIFASSKEYYDNVEIYNMLGQKIYIQSLGIVLENQEIDLNNFAKGTYLLKFNNNVSSKSIKVIKQ